MELSVHPERQFAPEEVGELSHHMLVFIVVFRAMFVVDDELPDIDRDVFHLTTILRIVRSGSRLATRQHPCNASAAWRCYQYNTFPTILDTGEGGVLFRIICLPVFIHRIYQRNDRIIHNPRGVHYGHGGVVFIPQSPPRCIRTEATTNVYRGSGVGRDR